MTMTPSGSGIELNDQHLDHWVLMNTHSLWNSFGKLGAHSQLFLG